MITMIRVRIRRSYSISRATLHPGEILEKRTQDPGSAASQLLRIDTLDVVERPPTDGPGSQGPRDQTHATRVDPRRRQTFELSRPGGPIRRGLPGDHPALLVDPPIHMQRRVIGVGDAD